VIDQVQAACTGEAAAPRAERTNALWHACRGGQQAVAELLLDAGADINWIGHAEKTPLDAATESKQRSLVSWLRSRGAKSASELP
jgi:ankyrin repeat protein